MNENVFLWLHMQVYLAFAKSSAAAALCHGEQLSTAAPTWAAFKQDRPTGAYVHSRLSLHSHFGPLRVRGFVPIHTCRRIRCGLTEAKDKSSATLSKSSSTIYV
ncbi:hypothetical protein TGPRC2_320135 [Toxoplasma gondii TgCatPRC2]|uniref:Secreted protein n=4 Tax=Toxoplasma gondii TaxID=5811 RepID=S7VYK7_TOXGG|nr:hypothetical protein TGME49_320135 [Toxoplasma gondii ME49]EPR58113.1 hypothetical protein TGGT1_320135 [Toxoplasma gondii GT1]EPT31561.1 hypothetical protein TGME49_320135 [Toxoplasma gondii ME49]KAF4644884.1 hypothetical protein TGRH88_006980 [Toxoplasma gondii]KYK66782.1 hypothetical protein TGPRC2_320135 [Toxoplasma gondii TgCatPRC2]|eukprot:XP_018638058.1 hypothetical protein TGME49_320135 [Toxoplasma gondii ME49]